MSDNYTLGKYQIIRELGRGAFGIVYEAKDIVLARSVAIKVLHPNLVNDSEFIARFHQEARLAAQLDHPNIVPIHDFDQKNGRYFIVMGLMRNGSIKDLLEKYGPRNSAQTKSIVEQAASGLAFAHERDIIHRDLKPGNILVDEHGFARVSDFGFAKAMSEVSKNSLSMTGGILGTPAYIPPEIWEGKAATPRSDIYSLGCITYEILTGKPLFDGESAPQIMMQHMIKGPQLSDSLNEAWRSFTSRCLARDPKDRYQSTSALLEDLQWGLFDVAPSRESEIILGPIEEEATSQPEILHQKDTAAQALPSSGDISRSEYQQTSISDVEIDTHDFQHIQFDQSIVTDQHDNEHTFYQEPFYQKTLTVGQELEYVQEKNTKKRNSLLAGLAVIAAILFVVVGILISRMLKKTPSKVSLEPPAEENVAPHEPIKDTGNSGLLEEESVVFEPEPFGENLPTAPTINTPFVVAYDAFSEKFSPFFSETAYDADVVGMTQIGLMTTDRLGQIVMNAIEGETLSYNDVPYEYKGTANLTQDYDEVADQTVYTARLRVGMKFSDGEPVTADDVIFTYYTYLDPSYVGSTSLRSYPIVGLKEYQTQTPTAVLDRYTQFAKDIYAAGPDHEWTEADAWTQELQDGYWAEIEKFGVKESQAIIDYVVANYADKYAEAVVYKTADEVRENEGLQAVLGMALWGFGDVIESGNDYKFVSASNKEWDMKNNFPTAEDFNREITLAYEGDLVKAWETETATDNTDVLGIVETEFIKIWGPQDEETGEEGVPNIAGITKLDDYTVQVVLNGFSAPAIYSVLGVSVTPLHYYGDKEQYDYENNQFGFPFGDLSKQQSLTPYPMGAGPYKFIKYQNRVVVFEANEYYYKGCPKIREIQFKETSTAEVASALNTGDADAGNFSPSKTNMEEIKGYNSNGELDGDVIVMKMVDNLGYGYIGINADTVKVSNNPGSAESKNLRKAFATIFAVHRDLAINSYYGEGASVINYPISKTSWAAPQPTDDNYEVAFSVDIDGNPIYTANMSPDAKYKAARQAALGFLEAAGFTVRDGKTVAAPSGAKLNYEIIVPGGGTGDHPAFAIITNAKADLAKIGITLNINDPSNTNILWDALDGGQQEMWTAAWGSTIDPDMYQVYHSSNVVGEGGTDSNHYHIRDAKLDQLIMDTRKSTDQNYRKMIFKLALDRIIDWAVEIPTYQRQNGYVFSTQRLNIDTLTPDITTFWDWMNDIELLEMLP